jgi:hypothetical protein
VNKHVVEWMDRRDPNAPEGRRDPSRPGMVPGKGPDDGPLARSAFTATGSTSAVFEVDVGAVGEVSTACSLRR